MAQMAPTASDNAKMYWFASITFVCMSAIVFFTVVTPHYWLDWLLPKMAVVRWAELKPAAKLNYTHYWFVAGLGVNFVSILSFFAAQKLFSKGDLGATGFVLGVLATAHLGFFSLATYDYKLTPLWLTFIVFVVYTVNDMREWRKSPKAREAKYSLVCIDLPGLSVSSFIIWYANRVQPDVSDQFLTGTAAATLIISNVCWTGLAAFLFTEKTP